MINRKETFGKAGIYCIENTINSKKYIGRSVNIYKRIITHVCSLNKNRSKHENAYLLNAWKKYGKENFKAYVLEFIDESDCSILDKKLTEKELYYIKLHDTLNLKFGYNLRSDDKTYVCHPDTRLKQSIAGKKRQANIDPVEKQRIADKISQFWKDNPERNIEMRKNVSKAVTKYKFISTNIKTKEVRIYNTHADVMKKNPTYKWQVIYAAANGGKKSAYGFSWERELIKDSKDIVQP